MIEYFLYLDQWLNIIQSQTCSLPSPLVFDYNYFFQVLNILLRDDHHATVTRALILVFSPYFYYSSFSFLLDNFNQIHNYFHLFPIEEKNKFVNILFGDYFFKLFLHWCFGARSVFHRICAYQVYLISFFLHLFLDMG